MARLSDITKMQNCFFTVDGHVLKTMQDVMDYLSSCSEENYTHHVNPQKNDFANWATDVLVCPKLGKILTDSKSLTEARIAVAEFLQRFDYRNKFIPQEKAFHTIDGYVLKSVHEVYYYIHNCSDGNFSYHCNSQKNDFANWVNDVLELHVLSGKIRAENTREGVLSILKDFLLNSSGNGINSEYEQYIGAHMIKKESLPAGLPITNSQSSSQPTETQVPYVSPAVTTSTTSSTTSASPVAPVTSPPVPEKSVPEKVAVPVGKSQSETVSANQAMEKNRTSTSDTMSDGNQTDNIISNNGSTRETSETNDVSDGLTDEEKITLKPLGLANREEEEDEKKAEANINKDSFRQYTDDELEKFTAFIRKEKNVDTDVKTEYLRAVLAELKNMVKELRLVEKDPFIADLMLRNISAKVDYYALSKNPEDYAHIIRLMKNVQQEIEDCSTHNTYNLAEEMFRDLKLQGITMKKA